MAKSKERYVVVATASRHWSVVAGWLVSEDGNEVELRDARMIVFWPTATKGLYGLAERGPVGGRVSPAAKRARVKNVEHVIDCTDEARKVFEAGPWT